MSNKQFDVIVIGAGPGGYIGAIRAAQLGMNVACIDEWKTADGKPAPGGTCTNVGCIPSKALLQSSEHYEHAGKHFGEHGISLSNLKMDVAKMIGRKDAVVKQNNDGILYLFKKNKVTFFHGRGSFVKAVDGGYEIAVAGDKPETLTAKQVIVATGSNARPLPGVAFDEEIILSNDGALRIGAVPKKLGVIGSGVIGLEMGSVWRRVGADVTVLEGLPTFLGAVDEQIAKEAKKALDKQGLKIELGVKVGEVKTGKKGVSVAYTNAKGEPQTLEVDKLIVSIGRVPNTNGLNPEAVGLKLGERGDVIVFMSPNQIDQPEDPTPTLVKRLVAVAGDTIWMRDGLLHVNGMPQRQSAEAQKNPRGDGGFSHPLFQWQKAYEVRGTRAGDPPASPTLDDWGPLVVPPNMLFMLGDNRYDSKDGRYWGLVPRENVRGRPVFVYYSYRADESVRPLPFLTDIRWGRIGTIIR